MTKKKYLVVAAHPDDEVLGCGGTIAKVVDEGSEVYTLILGEGITSRDSKRNVIKRSKDIAELKESSVNANCILGVKKVFFADFPDNRFDSIPLIDIVKYVENIISKIKPCIIFTHFEDDLNVDHKITYNAVITATRPIVGKSVKNIYSFEVLSSTEWKYPILFSPDYFVDISRTINKKLNALSTYKTELTKFPHPRSLEAVKMNSELWGIKLGLKNVEAFKVVRIIE